NSNSLMPADQWMDDDAVIKRAVSRPLAASTCPSSRFFGRLKQQLVKRSRHSGTNLSSANDLAILHESRPFLPDAFMHRYRTPSLGYGLGKVVESWYSTGIPPTTPK